MLLLGLHRALHVISEDGLHDISVDRVDVGRERTLNPRLQGGVGLRRLRLTKFVCHL